MATIIKHPSSDLAGSTRLSGIRKEIESDREIAISKLGTAVALLRSLSAKFEIPELNAMSAEIAVIAQALKSLDAANPDDGVQDQLQHMQDRLMHGLEILKKHTAHGDNYGQ